MNITDHLFKKKVLFVCTGNSCRSQMAEGWSRHLHPLTIRPYSAGLRSQGINAFAIKAMREVGVDISMQRSKTVDELKDLSFDLVVSVCSNAEADCPLVFPEAKHLHVSFDDPPTLARTARSEEEAFLHYQRVRDQIRAFVKGLPMHLASNQSNTRSLSQSDTGAHTQK